MRLNDLAFKGVGFLLILPALLLASGVDSKITNSSQLTITNATKRNEDVLVNTGVVLKQKPQLVSQLAGQGNRRIEVQRPVVEDGADETREYETGDEATPTDVLSEVTGRMRNKEEIFDTVRPYKTEDKYDTQDRQRPATVMYGKEINKEKNKGLLAAALSEDEKPSGYNSDDSIAEGASRKTLEIYIAEEEADQQKRHKDERDNKQIPNNNKNDDKTNNASAAGVHRNKTIDWNAVFQEALVAHNRFRSIHHVLPLQWNATLAEQAQNIAESVASDPSTFQGEPAGENIAQIWHDLPRAPLKATTIWYAEKKGYSFSYPVLSDNVKHFTQMVWKDTTQLGMGAAPSPSNKYVIVVALYRPLGNDIHRLRDNVQKPGPEKDVYATIKEKISKPNDEKRDKHNRKS